MIKFNEKFDPAHIKFIIFDLDGTLIDSRLDLINSVNVTLRHFGRPELADQVVASYIGDGATMLIQRAFGDPADKALLKEGLDFFLTYYRAHKLDNTIAYVGIEGALRRIRNSNGTGRQMAVLTNKPVMPARAIVRELGLNDFFLNVYGGNSFSTKKPDPLGVNTLLEETGHSAEHAVIVGDSSVDVLTGRNAGIRTCGVKYGFAPESLIAAPPDVEIDNAEELAEMFA